MPMIGYLSSGSLAHRRDQVAAFHRGLKETGYVEGINLKTAKSLGLTIPQPLLLRADEVIQ